MTCMLRSGSLGAGVLSIMSIVLMPIDALHLQRVRLSYGENELYDPEIPDVEGILDSISFENIDLSKQFGDLVNCLKTFKPDVIIHFAEQRAAPYSMKSSKTKRYTIDNNTSATHNLLCALVETQLDIHLIHLGTMGVYGYGTSGMEIPEGYLSVTVGGSDREDESKPVKREILYPTDPGSVYHLTKTLDQLMFHYYAKNLNKN